jgi:S1-C subfamily serine protease
VWTGVVLFEPAGRQSPPAYVDRVLPDSPAAQLGLRPDDLIVRVDDYSVRSCREFRTVLERYGPGDKVVLTWKRGTQVSRADLVLASAPQGEEEAR